MHNSTITMNDHGWSSLPYDIIQAITKLLPYRDRIRCRTVCWYWYSAIPTLELPSSPLFVIPYDDNISCIFLSVSTNDILSCAALPANKRSQAVIGSQAGHFILIDELLNISIVDPFAHLQYQLPPLTTIPEIAPMYKTYGSVFLRSNQCTHCTYHMPLHVFSHVFIHKIVFSSPHPDSDDFVAFATYAQYSAIIYIRAGDSRWTQLDSNHPVDHPQDAFQNEDIVFHAGKFYRLTKSSQVLAYDFSTDPPHVTVVTKVPVPNKYVYDTERYLAFSKAGELLVVFRKGDNKLLDARRVGYSTEKCRVMRFNSAKAKPYWNTARKLRDQSLLLGSNNAITVSTVDKLGIKENCIYFTDSIFTYLISVPGQQNVREVGVFDMKKKKFKQFYQQDIYSSKPPPIWFSLKNAK